MRGGERGGRGEGRGMEGLPRLEFTSGYALVHHDHLVTTFELSHVFTPNNVS